MKQRLIGLALCALLPTFRIPTFRIPPITVTAIVAQTAATASSPASRSRFTEIRSIGTSVRGRDIVAYRMGTPGGRAVLIIGDIHGDESKGIEITTRLRTRPIPAGIDLWVIDTVNPDGLAADTRQNANGVDPNRNYDVNWGYIPPSTTNNQYSGAHAADQPETQAVEAFIREIKPSISVWYHQDANRVSVGGARHEIPTRYAQLVGLSTASTPCTQGCIGTATQFTNHTVVGGTSFIVELPGDAAVTQQMVTSHVDALLAVMTM